MSRFAQYSPDTARSRATRQHAARQTALPMTLVLGGGGYPGIAYLAGALQALQDIGGIDPADASLVIGTSAGAVVGAMLRSGVRPHDILPTIEACRVRMGVRSILPRSPSDGVALFLRTLGSAWSLGRALSPIAIPRNFLDELPSGFGKSHGWSALLEHLSQDWPARPLWLVAVDQATGTRRVLSAQDSIAPRLSFAQAILASSSMPLLTQPILAGQAVLVDGGLHSTTNADLGLSGSANPILCIAPICYDANSPPRLTRRIERALFQSTYQAEQKLVADVSRPNLFIAPDAETLSDINPNFFTVSGLKNVHRSAFRQVSTMLNQLGPKAFLRTIART